MLDGENDVAQAGRVDMTFEEIEAQITADAAGKDDKKPKLEEIKLEDGVPDEFKGKSVAELVQLTKGLSDSLRLSESRRDELERARATQTQTATVQQPVEEKELTRDELAELHQKDPLAAIEYMQARSDKRAAENLEKRIGGLAAGAAGTAEANARAKYADEFTLFGDQIKAAFESGLVKKEAMAQPQAWDDLISWVRGKPGNIEKLFDHRIGKNKKGEAQAEQIATSGVTMRSIVRTPPPAGGGDDLDDLKKEIARNLFPDLEPPQAYAEYKKWSK